MVEEKLDIQSLQRLLSVELARLVESGEKSKAIAIAQQFEKGIFSQLGAMSDKPKLSRAFGETAYGIQITQECKPLDSIRQAAEHLNEDFDSIKSLKMQHDKWYHSKFMVRTYEQWFHEEGNKMLPKSELRKDVQDSETLNSGLNKVYKYQKLDKEIRKMKARMSELEQQQDSQAIDIAQIKEMSGWELDPKDKAKALKDKGYTYKQVATILGVTDRTIKRWLKN